MSKVKRIFGFILLMSFFTMVLASCGLQVPRPEIKRGEFDFSVTYEWDGETHTVSGVYVCEYDGTSWALDGGYYRVWKSYIKGDEMEDVIEIGTTADGGVLKLELNFYPEHFMGDPHWNWLGVPEPTLRVDHADDEALSIVYGAEDIEATYGARIVSYYYAPPIENTFGLFK